MSYRARKRYLKGLKTVLSCLLVLRESLEIGFISTLLFLDDFDVPHCMKRISSLIIDGTEPLTERTVPRVHKSVVDYLVSSRPDLHIDLTEQHHSFTTTQRLTFNVSHITSSHGLYEDISISQGIAYTCQ